MIIVFGKVVELVEYYKKAYWVNLLWRNAEDLESMFYWR